MPKMEHYTVIQTRSVKVTANTAEDAALIATAALTHGQNSDNGVIFSEPVTEMVGDRWGNTDSKIEVVGLIVTKES